MRLEHHFRVDHEPDDHPGTTLGLIELAAAGDVVFGAEVDAYYCETCDVLEAIFTYPEEDP
jgi:hypothetical protein